MRADRCLQDFNKLHSIAFSEMLHTMCMLTKVRKSLGGFFTSGRSTIPIFQPPALVDIIDLVQRYIFSNPSLSRLPLDKDVQKRFVSDLCKLATTEQWLSWLWGMAGSGKTAYLFCLITCIIHFHFLSRQLSHIAGPDADLRLFLSDYHGVDLKLDSRARVFALSDTNQATASFARRIYYNNIATGVSNSLLIHLTTVDEISPLTRDFNIYTKVWTVYKQVLPFDLGDRNRRMVRLPEDIHLRRLPRIARLSHAPPALLVRQVSPLTVDLNLLKPSLRF